MKKHHKNQFFFPQIMAGLRPQKKSTKGKAKIN